MIEQNTARWLYKKLLTLYPMAFRARLAESMEQTFNDLCTENRGTKLDFLGFVTWTFAETSIGIVHEHVLLVQEMHMKALLTNIGSATFIGVLAILPFIIMEVVNRRHLNEEFPFVLFFAMWLNFFAVTAILLPIVRVRWMRDDGTANSAPAQGSRLLTNPWWAALLSIVVFLAPGILPLLDSIGWLSVDRLFNGPNPEVEYLPGLFLTLLFVLFPIAAGIIAGGPVVNTLRAGGRLFAHPMNLIIVVLLSLTFATGVVSLVVDQWPCFMGVPGCD